MVKLESMTRRWSSWSRGKDGRKAGIEDVTAVKLESRPRLQSSWCRGRNGDQIAVEDVELK